MPELVRGGRYAKAPGTLAEIEALGATHRTRFASEASRVAAELLDELESYLVELERMRASGGDALRDSELLACAVLPELVDTRLEDRARALCP